MNENKLQIKGFLVWGICALFFLYEFFLRTVIGTFQHQIMSDLHLTSFQFSLLSASIFLLVYGLMQIPAGLIVDNIGLKKALLVSTTCCALSSFGFSYAHSYFIAIIYRMMMGFGASFGFICLLISVHDWMPHKYQALFIGLSQFIGTMGPMLAAGPLESLSHSPSSNIDWRFVFLLLGVIGFILLILIFFFVENNRKQTGGFTILYKPEKLSISIKRLFTKIQPWYIAILSTSLYFSVEYLAENEGRSFLMLKENISASNAGYMITLSWIGYAIGSPLLGFLSDMLERRKIILTICSLFSLASMITIVYLPHKIYLQIAFFALGMSASGQSIGFAIMAEQFKKQFVAIGFALNNAIITTIAAINAPVIGLMLDYTSGGKSFSLANYILVFHILIAISMIALLISAFFLKETYCKSAAGFTIVKK